MVNPRVSGVFGVFAVVLCVQLRGRRQRERASEVCGDRCSVGEIFLGLVSFKEFLGHSTNGMLQKRTNQSQKQHIFILGKEGIGVWVGTTLVSLEKKHTEKRRELY